MTTEKTSQTNPVLLAFREHVAYEWVYLPEIKTYAENVESFNGLEYDSFLNTTRDQVDFARKVIKRLVSWEARS